VIIRYYDFNFDTISIQYFENIAISISIFFKMISRAYVNIIQAQEQDVNVQKGSLLYIDTKMCQ